MSHVRALDRRFVRRGVKHCRRARDTATATATGRNYENCVGDIEEDCHRKRKLTITINTLTESCELRASVSAYPPTGVVLTEVEVNEIRATYNLPM